MAWALGRRLRQQRGRQRRCRQVQVVRAFWAVVKAGMHERLCRRRPRCMHVGRRHAAPTCDDRHKHVQRVVGERRRQDDVNQLVIDRCLVDVNASQHFGDRLALRERVEQRSRNRRRLQQQVDQQQQRPRKDDAPVGHDTLVVHCAGAAGVQQCAWQCGTFASECEAPCCRAC